MNEYSDFVWRSMRRLGVAEADCDDGCQRVWVVLAQKLDSIEPTKVRSYVFSVVVRVASEMRRNYRRHQHVEFDELSVEPGRPGIDGHDTEGIVEQQQVRQLLDQMLAGLSWDLRTVFVMYEIEGMSSPEIAEVLGISRGTVASRLRLGREAFQRSLQRHRARARGASPGLFAPAASPSSGGSSVSGGAVCLGGAVSAGAVSAGAAPAGAAPAGAGSAALPPRAAASTPHSSNANPRPNAPVSKPSRAGS